MLATLEEAPATRVISGEELDTIIREAYVLGNHVRRKLVMALDAMHSGRLYLTLGFSSIHDYAEHSIRCRKSETYDFLRVARALASLPRIDKAFEFGDLSWTDVREITKAATADTEDEWIEFAETHSLAQIEAEARDARRHGRASPRQDRLGLPSLKARVLFELEPHEHDKVSKAFAKALAEMGASLGEAPVEPKDALLYMAEQFLASDPATGAGRVARQDSIYTIVYRSCPVCHKADLPTPDGFVEIPPEVVDLVEGDACKVTITPEEERPGEPEAEVLLPVPQEERDRPNPPALVRKVLLRDGLRCANPRCGRKLGLQAHHIRFRANGGRTALDNECALCQTCHSLVHAGLLRIEGDPLTGLVWKPKCGDSRLSLGEELSRATTVAEVHVRPVYDDPPDSTVVEKRGGLSFSTAVEKSTVVEKSTAVENLRPDTDEVLAAALVDLGCTKKDAGRRLAIAHARLLAGKREATEENLMLEALRA